MVWKNKIISVIAVCVLVNYECRWRQFILRSAPRPTLLTNIEQLWMPQQQHAWVLSTSTTTTVYKEVNNVSRSNCPHDSDFLTTENSFCPLLIRYERYHFICCGQTLSPHIQVSSQSHSPNLIVLLQHGKYLGVKTLQKTTAPCLLKPSSGFF